MSLFRICTGAAIAAGCLMLAALGGAGDFLAPGAYAEEYTQNKKPARRARKNREAAVEQGSTPEEIARYFALHGGNIDPYINKQSPGGPFDSGFFFDFGHWPQRRRFTLHELNRRSCRGYAAFVCTGLQERRLGIGLWPRYKSSESGVCPRLRGI